MSVSPVLREAVRSDVPPIAALMRQSALDVFHLFVHQVDGQLVACGGWSKRDRLYTGSGAAPSDDCLLDPATEPARVRAVDVTIAEPKATLLQL